MKEFHEKGLDQIFVKKQAPVVKKESVPVILNKQRPEIKTITLPKVVKKLRPKIKKIQKEKVLTAKDTAFLTATKFRETHDLDEVLVNMDQFLFDYVFTLDQEKQFHSFVTKFSSQKSLKDMKKFDKLGGKQAPLPLKFIKFLIDKKIHKGLYNIVHIIGDRFYVLNDIDVPKDQVSYVKMDNSKETHFKWQLTIIRP